MELFMLWKISGIQRTVLSGLLNKSQLIRFASPKEEAPNHL